ncbi:vacuolar sorting protein 39-like [Syzygium oleosum]|uniref:vacuolar sorting protein 39-like n=1 Tax=Syzygium oleosum TaxID=219896 RepID=UPI0024BA67A5|nr:vacuolar sorting protein 39-like [Syzygium oleosum]XP_056175611.1 vacuolar sorting protein 39-like [Syzygium oleosum]XP_056175614.1 vacuolar sorting protein 39-like [Syzygium oleosum]XP_056175619.1 vacuolar sorting protein 39-like [Syzygium oleosum]
MVHRAYDLFHFLTDCPAKIEAVGSHASEIFLGCSDGSLRVYGPRPSRLVCLPLPRRRSDPSPPPPPDSRPEHRMVPYVLQRNVDGFAKRPFLSMEVLASRELLLTLSESIAFHRLPDLKTVAVLTEARGANACSWDDKRGFLCFARQKSVCIFRHDGGSSFVEVKEFGVPDTVEAMSWCGENICLALRREYVIMNATDGALSEVSPCGRVAPPLVVPLPSGELILGKDNVGVFVDQTGKLLPEGRICWSEAPQEVVIQKTYAIGLFPRYVEIRTLRVLYPLIQTVFLGNVRHLAQSSSAIVGAQDNSVCGFFPVPFGSQLVQLMESGNFEEALVLCKSFPPEDSSKEAKNLHFS